MIRTSQMSDTQFALFLKTHSVRGGKGDNTAKSAEANEGMFSSKLMQAFAKNNAAQQAQLAFLTGKLKEGIENPRGYSPETLAAMRTQATEAAAQNNAKVMTAVREQNALNGGASATALPSGVEAQLEAGVQNAEAQNESNAQLGITQKEGELENENRNRDIAALEGVSGLENPEGLASGANTAAGNISNLSQAVTQAEGPGIGSILGGVVGAGLGAFAGGFGGGLAKKI